MPIDTTGLNASIATLTTQLAQTVGTEDSAEAFIAAFAAAATKAVSDALAADAAANATTIAAASQAITDAAAHFAASAGKLGAAFVAPSPVVP